MQETIRVIQPGKRRVKIFVDFWNILISARKQTSAIFDLAVRWDQLAAYVVSATSGGHSDETTADLAGCYIFGSYAKSDPIQQKTINNVLDEYGSESGLFFNFSERIKKETTLKCKSCGSPVTQSAESGVDVLLCVEMIKHAMMREHEYLALISNDRDFLPMLSFLKDKGERVIHVATGDRQREMRAITWKQVDLSDIYVRLCKIANEEYIILTEPAAHEKLKEAINVMEENNLKYKIYDITEKDEISDQDLDFVLKNQMIFFNRKNEIPRMQAPARKLTGSISKFRQEIRDGNLSPRFPHISHKSEMEARFDEQWGWVVSGNNAERWQKFRKDPRK